MPCLFCQYDSGAAGVEAFFCGRCGKAQVENIILKHRTTANYDPGDFAWRPWREKINIVETTKFDKDYAALKYEARRSKKGRLQNNQQPSSTSTTFVNNQPWRPVGALKRGQLNHLKKKLIGPEEATAEDQKAAAEALADAEAEADALNKHYIKFLGHPFVKDERFYNPDRASALAWGSDDKSSRLDGENTKEREIIKSYQKTSPLSIYECNWIQTKFPVVCHVGLTETMIGLKRNHYLRVGVMLDDMIESDAAAAPSAASYSEAMHSEGKKVDRFDALDSLKVYYQSTVLSIDGRREKATLVPRGELVPLDILKNEIASISVPSDISWVDLYAITPNEPYIIKHTDSLFQYIAARVKLEWKKAFGIFDQINTINTKTQYDRTIIVSSYNLRPKVDDIIDLLCDSYLSIRKDFEEEKVIHVDKSLYTVSKKIRLGKLHFMKFLYCQVRIWIKFSQERWNESLLSREDGSRYHCDSSSDNLMVPTEVSSIILQVIPLRNDFAIRPKLIVLTRRSVEEVCKIPNLDDYVRSGKHAVMNILSDLCALICFQMTKRGVVVTMSCAVAELDIIDDYFESSDGGSEILQDVEGEADEERECRPGSSSDRPNTSASASASEGSGKVNSVRARYDGVRRSDAILKIQALVRKFLARCFFINKWNIVYSTYDKLVKKKAMHTKSLMSRPFVIEDDSHCHVHRDLETPCHCVCAIVNVAEDKEHPAVAIGVVCEFEAVDRDDSGEKVANANANGIDENFDFDDDDWIVFLSLLDIKSQMSTSMVIESHDIWDIMSFMYDDIVNNGSLQLDSFLNHHKFKVSSRHIAAFNQSKALIFAHAAEIQDKDVIFSIRDMLILPGVQYVVTVLVVRGLDVFLSRIGQSFMARYRRSSEMDRFLLLRHGEEGDSKDIVAL